MFTGERKTHSQETHSQDQVWLLDVEERGVILVEISKQSFLLAF